MFRSLALVAACSLFSVSALAKDKPAKAGKAAAPDITGEWLSEGGCEKMPNGQGGETYFNRHFWIDKAEWKIHFTTFGAADCTGELLQVEIAGPYKLGKASKAVAGATEGDFSTSKTMTVTPKAEGVLGWLNGAGVCGKKDWKVGEAHDVSKTGCKELGIKGKAQCKAHRELDLVKVEGDKLWFGDRSGDMCKARPTKMAGGAMVKKG